jgi:hypothetical protein
MPKTTEKYFHRASRDSSFARGRRYRIGSQPKSPAQTRRKAERKNEKKVAKTFEIRRQVQLLESREASTIVASALGPLIQIKACVLCLRIWFRSGTCYLPTCNRAGFRCPACPRRAASSLFAFSRVRSPADRPIERSTTFALTDVSGASVSRLPANSSHSEDCAPEIVLCCHGRPFRQPPPGLTWMTPPRPNSYPRKRLVHRSK